MTAGQSPPVHHVLWTGGWDSTYRVADLLLVHGRHVQPWYVIDPERRTTARELATMDRIKAALVARDRTVEERLRPTDVRERADLTPDASILEAARSVRARASMPEQYVWLAALADVAGVDGLELGIDERTDTPALDDVEVAFAPQPAPDDWAFVPADGNPADVARIFRSFRLPISELSKADTERLATAAGFADLLELTWFCRWPTVLGNPCGQCVPCRDTRSGGLARRVPPDTAVRRALHRWRWDWVRRRDSARIRAAAMRQRIGS